MTTQAYNTEYEKIEKVALELKDLLDAFVTKHELQTFECETWKTSIDEMLNSLDVSIEEELDGQ